MSEAADILAKTADAYAYLTTYRDTGTARSSNRMSDRERVLTFSTAFIRPSHFIFEYRDSGGEKPEHHVICSLPLRFRLIIVILALANW